MAAVTLFIIGGLVLLILNEILGLKQLPSALFLVLAFIAVNLVVAISFPPLKSPETLDYYSLKKIPFFFIGILLGIAIHIIPYVIRLHENASHETTNLTASVLFTTFLIVSWEELWFRNVTLTLFQNQILGSMYIGLLFLLVHFLNPQFDIYSQGLNVFIGGAFLTLLFLRFQNFWLPLGLHFANNIIDSKVHTEVLSDISPVLRLAMEHTSTLILLVLYLVLIFCYDP